jgi:hypothetical protein
MTSESARRILERIEAAWSPLREAADKLGPGRLEQRTPAGWTAKEMLASVAFWDEAAFGWITVGLRQQELPSGWTFGSGYAPSDGWPRADEHNAREAEWAREKPASEVLERCDRAHEQLLAIVATVTDEEAAQHEDYFVRLGDHYVDHMPELQALASEAG